METTEKIVEAYVRYIKGWATIPNIKCPGQYEIDLLAIDPKTNHRYHIESGVSISTGFSLLTGKKFDEEIFKIPIHKPEQRRTIGFFLERKFKPRHVRQTLSKYGFREGKYKKVIVSWGWTEEAGKLARKHKIELWCFPDLLEEIAKSLKKKRIYFTDDTLRTIHLYTLGVEAKKE